MPAAESQDKTIRCAVFKTIESAREAVGRLEAVGFTRDQISVLCSDEAKERHFREFEHEDPAGSHTVHSAAAGGMSGAMLGGLVTVGIATVAGIPLVALGPSFLVGGAVAGGLIGAMKTRGEEGALADFYDQALTRGDLLVAVTQEGPDRATRLGQADQIFRECGSEPIPLQDEV